MYTETINTIPRIYRILACPRKARILGWREKKKKKLMSYKGWTLIWIITGYRTCI